MARAHVSSPDCWCKPKVVTNGSTRTIEHRREAPVEKADK